VGGIQEKARIDALYDIIITSEAQTGLLSISRQNRRVVADAIDDLAFDPRPSTSKLLVKAENLRRLTVGDYRVIYGIEESIQTVTVELVRHRGIVYTLLTVLKTTVKSKYSK